MIFFTLTFEMKFKFQALNSAHAHIECTHACMCMKISTLLVWKTCKLYTIETHSKSHEDCTKLSSDDLRNLSGNNWLNDKVNNSSLIPERFTGHSW